MSTAITKTVGKQTQILNGSPQGQGGPPYLAMDWSNNFKNWASEVWYMMLTMLISVMRK